MAYTYLSITQYHLYNIITMHGANLMDEYTVYNRLLMRLKNLCFSQKRQFQMYADFIYVRLYMGCGYPTVDNIITDINYANYISAI